MGLAGRNAVITGGASGIGLAVARRLAADGASVAIFDREGPAAEKAASEIGERALACAVDVSDRVQVDAGVARVHQHLGAIHILVNNAGIEAFEPFDQIREETWDRIFAVNVRGAFHCTQAMIPDMIEAGWGRVINVSSSSAQTGSAMMVHYASSKAALFGFTRSLAVELGRHGITVNAVPPSMIVTPMLERSEREGRLGPGIDSIAARNPIPRAGQPEDIAGACAYLASEEAGYVTGQVLSVNGGRYM
jgi:NAD(P)-dependent dehydrogenase (short-subunit alcohol dehydrogenase family)